MRSYMLLLIGYVGMMILFSCRGECVSCSKSGSQTLNYCEGDFPDKQTYLDQINGLDSLGYTCLPK
jgi:hypothetical protein